MPASEGQVSLVVWNSSGNLSQQSALGKHPTHCHAADLLFCLAEPARTSSGHTRTACYRGCGKRTSTAQAGALPDDAHSWPHQGVDSMPYAFVHSVATVSSDGATRAVEAGIRAHRTCSTHVSLLPSSALSHGIPCSEPTLPLCSSNVLLESTQNISVEFFGQCAGLHIAAPAHCTQGPLESSAAHPSPENPATGCAGEQGAHQGRPVRVGAPWGDRLDGGRLDSVRQRQLQWDLGQRGAPGAKRWVCTVHTCRF